MGNHPHIVYVVEDNMGEEYTAHTSKDEAIIAGESLVEFDTSREYFLVPHTLH